MDMYCVKCKAKTKSEGIREVKTKNGKRMLKAICKKCGTRKNRFIAKNFNSQDGGCMDCFVDDSS